MDRITLHHIKDDIPEQLELFRRVFPDGAEVNEAMVLRAIAAGLSIRWLTKLLPLPALNAFYKAMMPSWNAYNEATAPAAKAYNEAVAPARKAYHEAQALALVPLLKAL